MCSSDLGPTALTTPAVGMDRTGKMCPTVASAACSEQRSADLHHATLQPHGLHCGLAFSAAWRVLRTRALLPVRKREAAARHPDRGQGPYRPCGLGQTGNRANMPVLDQADRHRSLFRRSGCGAWRLAWRDRDRRFRSPRQFRLSAAPVLNSRSSQVVRTDRRIPGFVVLRTAISLL